MFDIAWSEMVLIGAVALVVIGPKDLPKVLRTVGQTIGKVRRMAAEFQGQFNEAMREAELADLKKQVEDVGGSVSSSLNTHTDYKPIEEPKDFSASGTAGDVAKPDTAALKEAEAKLAAMPAPELPPVEIAAETPAAKPKRVRKAKPEEKTEEVAPVAAAPAAEAVEPVAKTNGAEPKPARARRVKQTAAVAPKEPDAPLPEKTASEPAKPARKRKTKTAKGEETSA